MNTPVRALVAAIVCTAPLAAQQPVPAYDVASVKPNRTATPVTRVQVAPGRYTWTAATLKTLINVAFQRNAFDQREVIGGPDWIDTDRFDVVVQAPAGAVLNGPDGFPGGVFAMIRAVLADRFGLVTHDETRERPVYALTVARADRRLGPGLKRSDTDCSEAMRQLAVPPPGGRTPGPPPCSFGGGAGRIQGTIVSFAFLANVLSRQVGRPVVDRTGVNDYFNFTLEFAPESDARTSNGPPLPQPPTVSDAPSIFTALQEQLGLKLEATRAPVDVLVIDRASPPTEN
ncbi:MAG TPA: TIGR03435 family protein [Vicinamibacterales bacterium]|jgi:uncharacterized protein (TIGR03435 family)|nr:TIGR03435 family protein [Vicinamibacterales bacterium]